MKALDDEKGELQKEENNVFLLGYEEMLGAFFFF